MNKRTVRNRKAEATAGEIAADGKNERDSDQRSPESEKPRESAKKTLNAHQSFSDTRYESGEESGTERRNLESMIRVPESVTRVPTADPSDNENVQSNVDNFREHGPTANFLSHHCSVKTQNGDTGRSGLPEDRYARSSPDPPRRGAISGESGGLWVGDPPCAA